MWISVITIDLNAMRALNVPDLDELLKNIIRKKDELITKYDTISDFVYGFQAVDNLDAVDPELPSIIVKRTWETEEIAQEFSDYVNSLEIPVTSTVEPA